MEAREETARGLPVLMAEVGPETAPTVVLHGHLDVVPALAGQFEPRTEGERLYGRGAYDMKGALAAMLVTIAAMADQDAIRVRLGIVGDEESEVADDRGCDHLIEAGFLGDFAITGEPTDLHIGVEAKGVLALRIEVQGRAAHGATPWLGDNAVLKAHDIFRNIESLPFARQSSELFDRPSINLGRIWGGDALNKVPDKCVIDVDIRYLPEQDPDEVLEQVRGMPDSEVATIFSRPPARVDRGFGLRPHPGRGDRPPSRSRAEERRPRRRIRRRLLPAGRRARGRVRSDRRRAPRARGVGLGLLPGGLPAVTGRLPAGAAGPDRGKLRMTRPEEGHPPPEGEGKPEPGEEQPTEEQFALEAGLPGSSEEHFEGIPPEQLPPEQPLPESGEFPALEPELADALRAAAGSAAGPSQAEPAAGQSPAPGTEERRHRGTG